MSKQTPRLKPPTHKQRRTATARPERNEDVSVLRLNEGTLRNVFQKVRA